MSGIFGREYARYCSQFSAVLLRPIWQDASPDILAIAATATNAIGNSPQRFYRVLLLP